MRKDTVLGVINPSAVRYNDSLIAEYVSEEQLDELDALQQIYDYSFESLHHWVTYYNKRDMFINYSVKDTFKDIMISDLDVAKAITKLNLNYFDLVLDYMEDTYSINLKGLRSKERHIISAHEYSSLHYIDILAPYFESLPCDTLKTQGVLDTRNNIARIVYDRGENSSIKLNGDSVRFPFGVIGSRNGEGYLKWERVLPVLRMAFYYSNLIVYPDSYLRETYGTTICNNINTLIDISEGASLGYLRITNSGDIVIQFKGTKFARDFYSRWLNLDFKDVKAFEDQQWKDIDNCISALWVGGSVQLAKQVHEDTSSSADISNINMPTNVVEFKPISECSLGESLEEVDNLEDLFADLDEEIEDLEEFNTIYKDESRERIEDLLGTIDSLD